MRERGGEEGRGGGGEGRGRGRRRGREMDEAGQQAGLDLIGSWWVYKQG